MLKSSINTLYIKYLGEQGIENLPIYYIGGSQTLPPPLSPEEEEKLLNRLSKKDMDCLLYTSDAADE